MKQRKLKNPRTKWQRFKTWLGCKIAGIDYRLYLRGKYKQVKDQRMMIWNHLNEQSNAFKLLPKQPFPKNAEIKTSYTDMDDLKKLYLGENQLIQPPQDMPDFIIGLGKLRELK